ncbi:MAG: type I CRISPR-associated protein Cas7 [Bacteroidetes bacterium]|nr:type I CRISPR-associated protein Cas7 [Bacteroidota bacterium]
MSTTEQDVMNRATGLLVIEVINSNPNGDPDRESDPRYRDIDWRGEISPVSFKRKVRDLIDDKNGPVWNEVSKKFNPILDPNRFSIFEQRYRDRNLILSELREDDGKIFKNKYWDGRIFGNTFLEKVENEEDEDDSTKSKKRDKKEAKENSQKKTIKTGVVQFGLGISVAPIRIQRLTTTSKAGVETGKDQGMAPLGFRIAEHGIYCIPYFVNPSAAGATDCKRIDIEFLLKVIPYAYSQTTSYIRNQVEILHAWHIEHRSPIGSCSDFDLITALTPKKNNEPEKPSSSRADYTIPTEKDVPEELKKKVLSIRDLMKEI